MTKHDSCTHKWYDYEGKPHHCSVCGLLYEKWDRDVSDAPAPKHGDGGPAFPHIGPSGVMLCHGMSLHDWYVGQAICGLLAYPKNGDASFSELVDKARIVADHAIRQRREAE